MKNKRYHSFFRLLLGNYIFFTVIIVVTLFLLFGIGIYFEATQYQKINPSTIMRFSSMLSRGEYADIDVESVLGKGGYIAILDRNGKLIYQSDEDKTIPRYTKSELELIQKYNGNQYLETYDIESDGQSLTCIITTELLDDGYAPTNIMVVDKDLNIVYQSSDTGKKKLTPNEFSILNTDYESNYKITPFGFTDQNNRQLILLAFSPRALENAVLHKINGIYISVFFSFLLIYCVIIFLIIMWLNRTVKKPIMLLRDALNKTADGNFKRKVNYKGPREFVEICNSFNDMSERLYTSEMERIRLEQERSKLLADISHDLKTPITVIQGYAKAVSEGMIPLEKQSQYLNTICQKADMLDELINVFHEYSKLEHPDYVLNMAPCDICNFLRDYMADQYNEVELAGFELVVDIPETHIMCNIDEQLFKRVLGNLISNCLKYNKEGTTLYCKLSTKNQHVYITLADNGVGVPAEIAKTLFDPFLVGEKSRSNKGSGLGLAIAKKIITAHNGTISLVLIPEKDYKTQFEIVIPILVDNG